MTDVGGRKHTPMIMTRLALAGILSMAIFMVSVTPAVWGAPADYDANANGTIEKDEVIVAIRDYFAGGITKIEAIELIRYYFSGGTVAPVDPPDSVEPGPMAELGGLSLTHGDPAETLMLAPAFSSADFAYTASVGYEVVQVTVTAMASDGAASAFVQEDGITAQPDADSGTEGHQVTLTPGENVIRVAVTAGDASQIYIITVSRAKPTVNISAGRATADEGTTLLFTVTRSPVASDAMEVTMNVAETGGAIDPGNEGIKTVTIAADAPSVAHALPTAADDAVWNTHSTVTVTLQPDDAYTVGSVNSVQTQVRDDDFPQATAVLTVDPNPVPEGGSVTVTVTVTTDSGHEPNAGGGAITVSTSDGTATQPDDYGPLSQVHNIAVPDFSPVEVAGSTRYQATYTSMITVVDDTARESGEAFTVSMTKTNADMLTLASPSAVSIVISESADATLSALSLSGITLSPTFSADTETYTVTVDNSVSSTTVTTALNNAGATAVIKIDGTEDADGRVDLAEGSNLIAVEVTAEDGVTTKAYTVTVSRAAAPAERPLSVVELVKKVRASVVRIESADGTGSGVVFDTDGQTGFIVTNQHVVGLHEQVTVTVGDETAYDGAVLGIDAFQDLAVVRICCADFSASEFGDDEALDIGAEVVAMGYPLGIAGAATVTRGIVSAVRDDEENLRKLIQTDAPINPGNSGGPLFTLDGLVVGITTFARVSDYGAEGLAFAVAESTVRQRTPGLLLGHSRVNFYFSDEEGVLQHDDTGQQFEWHYIPDFEAANLWAGADFTNPYDAVINPWSYGLRIRWDYAGAASVFFVVYADLDESWWDVQRLHADGDWERLGGGPGVGNLDDLLTGYGAENRLVVRAIGHMGLLFVNGEMVADINLGDATGSGRVAVFTGLYPGDQRAGAATRYTNLYASPIYPTGFGPYTSVLEHDDDQVDRIFSFWASDVEANVTFTNPYPASIGSWDYGLLFRDDPDADEFIMFYVYAQPNGTTGWQVRKRVSDGQYDTDAILAQGSLNGLDFNTGDGERNTLTVHAQGDTGMFYVNGMAVGSADLSAVTHDGYIGVFTGYYHTVAGAETPYENFTGSRLY